MVNIAYKNASYLCIISVDFARIDVLGKVEIISLNIRFDDRKKDTSVRPIVNRSMRNTNPSGGKTAESPLTHAKRRNTPINSNNVT